MLLVCLVVWLGADPPGVSPAERPGMAAAAPAGNAQVTQAGPGDEPVTFAVIGDYGYVAVDELAGPSMRAVADLVRSWNPRDVVTTGDNNYPVGAAETIDRNIGQYYQDFIAPYRGSYGPGAATNRFFPTLGNHDWATAGAQPYLNFFELPGNERYYNVEVGPVRVFALDSDPHEPDGITADSRQAAWLREGLAQSTACWNLVFLHHAPYSSGAHGPSPPHQWPFAAWGADAVLAGHDHTYERIHVDGLPYFVNGLGGARRTWFNAPVPGSQVRYVAGHGAMRVTASTSSIVYEFVATDGTVVDSHERVGGCAEPTPTVTATPLPTATPTATAIPTACTPRSPVRIRTNQIGGGALAVTVSATSGTVPQANRIESIVFGAARNAVVEVAGQPARPGQFDYHPGMVQTEFVVRRAAPGAFTVPFVVVDACGEWPTFVGGGPNIP